MKCFVPALGGGAAGRWKFNEVTTPTFPGAGSGTCVGSYSEGNTVLGGRRTVQETWAGQTAGAEGIGSVSSGGARETVPTLEGEGWRGQGCGWHFCTEFLVR